MRANFIKMLCENEIKSTEIALATESISDSLQKMIEQLTNIKVKDISDLVKRIKFDGDIEEGESFNQSMTQKLDQAIQSLTEIKGDIDNEVVSIFNGEGVGGSSEDNSTDFEDSDMANDFGGDEEVPEFNPDDEDESDDSDEDESDDIDLDDIDLSDEPRELK